MRLRLGEGAIFSLRGRISTDTDERVCNNGPYVILRHDEVNRPGERTVGNDAVHRVVPRILSQRLADFSESHAFVLSKRWRIGCNDEESLTTACPVVLMFPPGRMRVGRLLSGSCPLRWGRL